MDAYAEDDFEENPSGHGDSYVDSVEEEHEEDLEHAGAEEDYTEEEYDENELEELERVPVNDVLLGTSAEADCRVLQEEVRLLKLENDLLLSREKSLRARLEALEQDNNALSASLLDSQRQTSSLNKEIELIKCRSEARQSTLENNYRDLCSKIATSEEANQKIRFDLNQQRAKNAVLEELVDSKNNAIAELERRLDHLPPSQPMSLKVNGELHPPGDKVSDLTSRLHATEQQLDMVVSELSKVVSSNSTFKNSFQTNMRSKYLDYHAMLRDYNAKCVRLRELEERLHNDDHKHTMSQLEDQIKHLNERLASKSNSLKENERELKEFYSRQLDDLKNTISEQKSELASRAEEVNKLNRRHESLLSEFNLKNNLVVERTEALEQAKSQYQNLLLEHQDTKNKLNDATEQLRTVKMENQLVLEREETHLAEFKNFSREAELKVKKLQLLLNHAKSEAAAQGRPKETQADSEVKVDFEFRQQVTDEFSELKQLVASLDRSKKEQQQNNNLILTLRHQNDTALSTLREENKTTLNLFSEKNNAALQELKRENSNAVLVFKEHLDKALAEVRERECGVMDTLKKEIALLKQEIATSHRERVVVHTQTPAEVASVAEESADPELAEKYNKLKESFKETTASLLKKEKILLDSLKKTVLECHTYKEKLQKLTGPNGLGKGCSCSSMVRPKDGQHVRLRSCWCSAKENHGFRFAVSRKAAMCDSALLGSLGSPKVKRRPGPSSAGQQSS